jgi:RHS repeat-associated protein
VQGKLDLTALPWPAKSYNSYLRVAERQEQFRWLGSMVTGQRDASGQFYRRNRYYDATSGRFTQEDPIGFGGGLNLYGFGGGDPVSYSDPYGLYIIIHGDAAYRRRMLNALLYVAQRSETFRNVYNALATSERVTVRIGPNFALDCWSVSVRGACTTKAGLWSTTTLTQMPLFGDDLLENGITVAHEIFHAAGMLTRDVETGVPAICGHAYRRAAAEACADRLEDRTRAEVERSREERNSRSNGGP